MALSIIPPADPYAAMAAILADRRQRMDEANFAAQVAIQARQRAQDMEFARQQEARMNQVAQWQHEHQLAGDRMDALRLSSELQANQPFVFNPAGAATQGIAPAPVDTAGPMPVSGALPTEQPALPAANFQNADQVNIGNAPQQQPSPHEMVMGLMGGATNSPSEAASAVPLPSGPADQTSGTAALFDQSPVGAQAPDEVLQSVHDAARSLSGTGISNREAKTILGRVAANAATAKMRQRMSVNDPAQLTAGMTAVPEHNTYRDEDGIEWFVHNGKLNQYRPSNKAARILFGDDGNVYPFDANGNPTRPVPEGVKVMDHSDRMKLFHIRGQGEYKTNPDGSAVLMIPEAIPMTAKEKSEYRTDLTEAATAQSEYDAADKAYKNQSVLNPFGLSQKDVEAKKSAAKSAQEKLKGWWQQYPELGKVAQAASGQPTVQTQNQPAKFQSEAEAEAAAKAGTIKPGDRIIVAGQAGTWQE
jgi:hypothetical protein